MNDQFKSQYRGQGPVVTDKGPVAVAPGHGSTDQRLVASGYGSTASARGPPAPWEVDRLTRKEAAKYLGVSPNTLEVWACTGRYKLKYIKVGRKVFYRRSHLDAFLKSREVGGDT